MSVQFNHLCLSFTKLRIVVLKVIFVVGSRFSIRKIEYKSTKIPCPPADVNKTKKTNTGKLYNAIWSKYLPVR